MRIDDAKEIIRTGLRNFEANEGLPVSEIDWRWVGDDFGGFCVAPDGREYCLGALGVDRADS